ncbi:MAG: PAS domain S-box protein [Spirochaetes bacterium]|nr:PAS domain S-box protein [Spirochaetota bacterium]
MINRNDIKILIVEDDDGLSKLIKIDLERNGFNSEIEKKGLKAVEWVKENPNSILLLDYKLLDIDAYEMVKKFKENNLDYNVIIITGHSDVKLAVEMMKMGIKDYLIKDINFLDLLPTVINRVIEDIENQRKLKEAQTAREESENRYRSFVQNFQGIAYRTDLNFVPIFLHGAVEQITGYSEEDFMTKKISINGIIHPEDVLKVKENFDNIKFLPDYSFALEYRIIRKDREIKWIYELATNICDKSGKPAYIQGSIYDITDRKKAEDELFSEKERLSAIIKSINDGMIVTDLNGKILLMNNVAEELTGWNISDATGISLNKVYKIALTDKDREQYNYFETLINKNDDSDLFNKILISKDGLERIIIDSASIIYDKNNNINGLVLVFRDVTEKQKMEEELQKANKFDSLSTFAGGIAHDFNNLLAVIMGNLSLVLLNLNPEEENYSILTESKNAIKQAKDLSKQLVSYSKGAMADKKEINIIDIINNSVSFLLRKTNIKVSVKLPDIIPSILADEGQIIQVFNNLILNAKDAMPDGGKLKIIGEIIELKNQYSVPLKAGNYFKIIVNDNGPGISEKLKLKIFDPYFTTKDTGTGLGLAICYSIIKKHDGHITVESKEKQGTTFYIYLPIAD